MTDPSKSTAPMRALASQEVEHVSGGGLLPPFWGAPPGGIVDCPIGTAGGPPTPDYGGDGGSNL